jgi:hypothetical protein
MARFRRRLRRTRGARESTPNFVCGVQPDRNVVVALLMPGVAGGQQGEDTSASPIDIEIGDHSGVAKRACRPRPLGDKRAALHRIRSTTISR